MNFKGLQDLVGEMLNFTDGITDGDFTLVQIKASINRGYSREVRQAKLRANLEYFKSQTTLIWPASTQDMKLNSLMKKVEWIRLEDITDTSRGTQLDVGKHANESLIYHLDKDTLRWGSAGPDGERTLRLSYLATAEELIDDEDTPTLITPEYHEVIAYSSAVELRAFADEEIPAVWYQRYAEFQMQFWKSVTRGRPHIGGDVTVINRYPDDNAGSYSTGATSDAAQDGSSIGQF